MDRRLSLSSLQASGAISPVDVHLTNLAARLTNESRPDVQLAMALASQWPQRGHVCVDLAKLVPDDLWESQEIAPDEQDVVMPQTANWIASLKDSKAIGSPGDQTPFVLWKDRWLYLRRHWTYENEISIRLRSWLMRGQSSTPGPLHEDKQEQAVQLAAAHPFFILTGGPGTGKTTTVLRILGHLLSLHPELRIALAAPTGKAALRLQESIAAGVAALEVNDAIATALLTQAHTLHRLLGYQRHQTTFKHHADNPLPYDLVIVDEASMMDLGLFAKLLRALKPNTRLLLVGDREQLPSVDAGAVFKALCSEHSPLPRVELTRNYRFAQDTGIGALAVAIRNGDADLTELLLADDQDASCTQEPLPSASQMRDALWQRLGAYLRTLANCPEPDQAFEKLDELRILCAHRRGPYGTETINEYVRDILATRMGQSRVQRWYPGRPILITENDYAVELFNGDTGILLPWNGKLHAFFRTGDGNYRRIPPARLPAHESAYAMTVHKSQGSEFTDVLLVLSDQASRLLTRELLYTGVTRARNTVSIWGPISSVRASVERPLQRTSGLAAWFKTVKLIPKES